MTSPLTDAERERFSAMRASLAGVDRADPEPIDQTADPGPFDPMLAESFDGDLENVDPSTWLAERKYDGTRIILQRFDDTVHLFTRRHIDRASTLPVLTDAANETLPNGLILDGEYCYLTPDGTSRFVPIHQAESKIAEEGLTATYFIFDILAHGGVWCVRRPLHERKELLHRIVHDHDCYETVAGTSDDIPSYFDELVSRGEEGIVLKRRSSHYHIGTRSAHWRKVKAFTERDVIVVGYTPGEGARSDTFGALVMSDGIGYIGRVGTGFSERELIRLLMEMTPIESSPVPRNVVGRPYTAVDPFVASVKYQAITPTGRLRAPVYLRTRPDKPKSDVRPIQRE